MLMHKIFTKLIALITKKKFSYIEKFVLIYIPGGSSVNKHKHNCVNYVFWLIILKRLSKLIAMYEQFF